MFEKRENKPPRDEMGEAWTEAAQRLTEIDEKRALELILFTSEHTADEIAKYFEERKNELTPQEKFFFEITLQRRKSSPEYDRSVQRIKEGK